MKSSFDITNWGGESFSNTLLQSESMTFERSRRQYSSAILIVSISAVYTQEKLESFKTVSDIVEGQLDVFVHLGFICEDYLYKNKALGNPRNKCDVISGVQYSWYWYACIVWWKN